MKDFEIYAWVTKICAEELIGMHCNNRKILLLKKKALFLSTKQCPH